MRSLSFKIVTGTFMAFAILLLISMKSVLSVSQPDKSPHGTGFSLNCKECHTPDSWEVNINNMAFNHSKTGFSLDGQHQELKCTMCHKSLKFKEIGQTCSSCHTDVHENTNGPECERCHNTNSWLVNSAIKIHITSRFPLLGVHATVDCYACHKSASLNRFDVLGTDCFSCHSADYLATSEPNHTSVGFSRDCEECHTVFSNQWQGSGFNHDFFPLSAGHDLASCSDCHKNGVAVKISPECNTCHQSDYTATTNPNHVASGFPVTCSDCHTTNPGWKPAEFDHSAFPLTLGHGGVECASCHLNGNYSNTSSNCISCHQSDYNATTNPVHSPLGFSQNCLDCHTTDPGWKPAKYLQHDALSFPIYSGRHRGEWDQCTDCHLNPSNYKSFTCISCHEHNKSETDGHHREVGGYTYTATSCYTCHPRGVSGD